MMLIVVVYYFLTRFEWFEKICFVLVTSFFIYYLFYILVPVAGLEPARHRWRWILSPLRLPFHHTGRHSYSIVQIQGKCKKKFSSPPGKTCLYVSPGGL